LVTLEAILLVGGQGSRLRPLTISTPKPMLAVAGVPFLTHLLARLAAAGITHAVLGTSYQAQVFADHFGDGAGLGLRLDYVTETEPLGTGGGIRNVADVLCSGRDDPVLVLNGDVLSGHDLSAQLAEHERSGAALTLHLTEVADARAFGCVPLDDTGRVISFLEKMDQPVTNRINAGCYVFNRSVIDVIPAGRPVSVERETFPEMVAAGIRVQGYVESAYWLDLGTPAAFVTGSADLVTGVAPSAALPGPVGECLVLPGAVVAPDAILRGGTAVGRGCRVGPGAALDGSVLLDGAAVGAGAVLRRSIVGRDTTVGDDCELMDAVIGDGVVVGARNELRAGIRVFPGAVLSDGAIRFSSDRP
jgi:mannose-1-phosphate guanylyltransferase